MTTGTKKAVEAVLLMNAPRPADASITTTNSRMGDVPVNLRIFPPTRSTTPVRMRAAVRMSSPRIMITVSLPNPWKATSGLSSLVKTRASTSESAVTSGEIFSMENRTTAASVKHRSRPISKVMQ